MQALGRAYLLPRQPPEPVYLGPHLLDIAVQSLVIHAVDQLGHLQKLLRLPEKNRREGFSLGVGEDDGVAVF